MHVFDSGKKVNSLVIVTAMWSKPYKCFKPFSRLSVYAALHFPPAMSDFSTKREYGRIRRPPN